MTENYSEHNRSCRSEHHDRHLCYIVSQGFHLTDPQRYKTLVAQPRFKCGHCGRPAHLAENLCEPQEL